MLWYVNATANCCGTALSFVKMRTATAAGAPEATTWSAPNEDLHWTQPGQVIWHLTVREIPDKSQFWAVYPAYPSGQRGCGGDDLYFARSSDGERWERFPVPILLHDDVALSTLYRSDFVYDRPHDLLRTWVSAMDTLGRWNIYYTSLSYSRLIGVLERAKRLDPSKLKPQNERAPGRQILLEAP